MVGIMPTRMESIEEIDAPCNRSPRGNERAPPTDADTPRKEVTELCQRFLDILSNARNQGELYLRAKLLVTDSEHAVG